MTHFIISVHQLNVLNSANKVNFSGYLSSIDSLIHLHMALLIIQGVKFIKQISNLTLLLYNIQSQLYHLRFLLLSGVIITAGNV